LFDEGLTSLVQRVQSLSYHYDGRLELHVIGGFVDSRRIAVDLAVPLLRKNFRLSRLRFLRSKKYFRENIGENILTQITAF
jgi:hypothetical protein